ncbi:MAG: FG-GAP repeat protein, partial [Phycisphaerae bacterium]
MFKRIHSSTLFHSVPNMESVSGHGSTARKPAKGPIIAVVLMAVAVLLYVVAGSNVALAKDVVNEMAKLLASDGAANDAFGCSVSIGGDYAIVGALGDDGEKGSAYIFKWGGTSWSQQQKLTASDGAAVNLFGCSVS